MSATIDGEYSPIPELYREPFAHLADAYYEILELMHEYEGLFGQRKRVGALNDAAPFLFFIIQISIYDQILLRVARLLDRPVMQGKEITSLGRLVRLLKEDDKEKLAAKFEKMLKSMRETNGFIRISAQRNKRIAHNEHAFFIGKEQLSSVSFSKIRSTMRSIHRFLSYFSKEFGGHEIADRVYNDRKGTELFWDYITKALGYDELESLGKIPRDYQGRLARERGLI
jgi:hypothetical protein